MSLSVILKSPKFFACCIVLVFSMWALFSTVQKSHLHETFFYIEDIYIESAQTAVFQC